MKMRTSDRKVKTVASNERDTVVEGFLGSQACQRSGLNIPEKKKEYRFLVTISSTTSDISLNQNQSADGHAGRC
jgi:hypothetical protein